ncbi:MAG: glycosyltransferase [Cyanobacteriota bacterium]|nr:glycosyltransferase [Cyanobacteriota bacterium]
MRANHQGSLDTAPDFQPHIQEILDPSATKVAVLVTNEFAEIAQSGGIGTYYSTLSQQLEAEGWTVILLLCQTEKTFKGETSFDGVHHVFSTREIPQILILQFLQEQILAQTRQNEISRSFDRESFGCLFFLEAIAQHCADAVIYAEFPEIWGMGYRTLQAQQCGLLASHCFVGVTAHGPFEWLREGNRQYAIENPQWLVQAYHYERFSFENANIAYTPSRFLAAQLTSYGWKTDRACHLPYFIPNLETPATDRSARQLSSEVGTFYKTSVQSLELKPRPPRPSSVVNLGENSLIPTPPAEVQRHSIPLVFFGRLEERKGLLTFIEAARSLPPQTAEQFQFIFLGQAVELQSPQLYGLSSPEYIQRELGDFDICIETGLARQAALQYISQLNSPIICLASAQENFPNAALEMGQLPLHLVVADAGGWRETLSLVQRNEGVHWFVPGSPQALAAAIARAVCTHRERPAVADRAQLQQTNQSLLDRRLEFMSEAFLDAAPKEAQRPKVAIAVLCWPSSPTLLDCLQRLAQQTYDNLEIVVLSPNSEEIAGEIAQLQTKFPAFKYLSADPHLSLGGAYNHIIAQIEADYLLPLLSDRLLDPRLVATLVTAITEAEAAIAVCPIAELQPTGELGHITLIDGNLLNLLEFKFRHDLVALFKTDFLHQFPYCAERNLQALNWHLFAAAIATDTPIAYYPYPLYCIHANAAPIASESWPKERYYLRQYLLQIEPARWEKRQINVLLTGFEQLLQAPSLNGQWGIANVDLSSPQNQAWQLTAQQLHAQLAQTQSQLTALQDWNQQLQDWNQQLQDWNQQLQTGKDWLEGQWQTWMLRAQKAEWEWQRWYALVEEMQRSKFWQLRNRWFKFKQKLGKIGDDPLQSLPQFSATPGVGAFVARIAGQKIRFFQPAAPETPLVSIISTCFEEFYYIETTYRSVVNQTLQNFEWIVVDDGSEEAESRDFLAALPQRTAKIRLLSQPSHQGKAASYNCAIAQARGKYLCFLDIGGILDPTYLEKCVLVLETRPEVGFVNSYSIAFQGREQWWNTRLSQKSAIFEQQGMWSHPVYRQAEFESGGGFDESLRWEADWERCLRAIARGQMGWTIREYLDCYRCTPKTTPAIAPEPDETAAAEIEAIRERDRAFFDAPPSISLDSQPLDLDALQFRFDISPTFKEVKGTRLLLFCSDLDNHDVARWNCELVKSLEQRGFEIAIATTDRSNHTLQEFFYPAAPQIFHLPHLLEEVRWLAFSRYLVAQRQIDGVIISGANLAYYFLPLLRAEFPQLALLDYTHPKGATGQNFQFHTLSCQFSQYLDRQLVSSHHQAQEYRSWKGSDRAQIEVCYTLDEVELAVRDAIAQRQTVTAEYGVEGDREALLLLLEYLQEPPQETQPAAKETEPSSELSGRELLALLFGKIQKRYTVFK